MDSSDWDQRYASRDRLWSPAPNDVLVAAVAGLRPGRALDLGCGEGADALWLAERGWKVTAVDFSSVALERARAAARSRGLELCWVRADLRSYMPSNAPFDLVTLLFIHLPPAERPALLARTAALVAPGGTLIVAGHDRSNPPEAHGPRRPDVLFTPEEIVRELSAELAGEPSRLTVERAERVTRPELVDGGEVQAVDALVVARRRP